METLSEKMRRLSDERERIAAEEATMHDEAVAELERVNDEIEALEARKEQLEAFLGLNETSQRAGHGQILQLCLRVVSESPRPLSSAEVKDILERENPGMKLTSVPGTLSRLVTQGRMRRDELGRYLMA